MIQRIQTVYLFVSLILSFLLYYFPFYRAGIDGSLIVVASDNLYLMPTAALVILMHIPVIFYFKQRKLQASLALWLMALLALYLALGIAASAMEDQYKVEPYHFRLGALLPPISLTCTSPDTDRTSTDAPVGTTTV